MADIDRDRNKNFTSGNMKMNCWLILGVMLATSAVAQDNTNTLPPIPAPSPAVAPAPGTPGAGGGAGPKRRRPSNIRSTRPPRPPRPYPNRRSRLFPARRKWPSTFNVRGQAGLKGEVVAHLKKGDAVTVLGQINLDKHKADEPAQWAKIALPSSTHVWVESRIIDATNKTVLPKKLNLRAGPGENYSVLGVIERGTAVNEITDQGRLDAN